MCAWLDVLAATGCSEGGGADDPALTTGAVGVATSSDVAPACDAFEADAALSCAALVAADVAAGATASDCPALPLDDVPADVVKLTATDFGLLVEPECANPSATTMISSNAAAIAVIRRMAGWNRTIQGSISTGFGLTISGVSLNERDGAGVST